MGVARLDSAPPLVLCSKDFSYPSGLAILYFSRRIAGAGIVASTCACSVFAVPCCPYAKLVLTFLVCLKSCSNKFRVPWSIPTWPLPILLKTTSLYCSIYCYLLLNIAHIILLFGTSSLWMFHNAHTTVKQADNIH